MTYETKYLGVIINSSMKTSSDVVRQTRKFYAQANMLLCNFRYCNSAPRYLLLIKKPYSASTMFITHGIPSFYELLRISIYRFADRVNKNSNSIIIACMTPIVYIHSPIRQCWRSVFY